MAHWHEDNPWAESLRYVPIEDLAEALAGGAIRMPNGSTAEMTPDFLLKHWHRNGQNLDAYLIYNGDGRFSAGVRYGAEGKDYLSPHIRNMEPVSALYEANAPVPGEAPPTP